MLGKMRVFLSSTCYDLPDFRARIERYLHKHGHIPLLSDRPEFPVRLGQHRHDVCVELAGKADMLIIVIDKRYGAPYVHDSSMSVTWAEFQSALSNNVFVRAFVRKAVFDERNTWKNNPNGFKPTHCDNIDTFRLLDEIQTAKPGIWCLPFNNAEEVIDHLDAMLQADDGPPDHPHPDHDYENPQRVARRTIDSAIAKARYHSNLRLAREMMEDGLRLAYRFSLSDPEWNEPPPIADMAAASRDFRCFGDILRTQREGRLAFAVYSIAERLMASAVSSNEVDCESGKRLSSLGEWNLRFRTDCDSITYLEKARACLLQSIQLHEKHSPCWFELFQSHRILADVLIATGDVSGAQSHLDQAEQYWNDSGAVSDSSRRRLLGWMRRSRGDYYAVTDQLKLAAEMYRDALNIFKNDTDSLGIAVILRRLAFVQALQGEDATATEMRAKALHIVKSLPGAEILHEQFERADDLRPDRRGIVSLP